MNLYKISLAALLLASAASINKAFAQAGQPYIHDPSTIAESNGKYFTFGTGGGGLISEDGWSWHGGAERPGGGAAPDVIKIGDRYLVIYGATGGGLGGGHNGRILTMWNKSLDPKSPDFKYTEPIEVASSDGLEDCDAIDPGVLLDPTDGRMWLSYGTYFGNIRLIELDPKTGERVKGNKELDIAIDCEATDLIYRDGYYYLLGTHGTCCDGVNSTYNIVCGRSKKVTGPYIDNVGRDMKNGGGKMVKNVSAEISSNKGGTRNNTNQVRISRMEDQKVNDPAAYAKNGGDATLKILKSQVKKTSAIHNAVHGEDEKKTNVNPNVTSKTSEKKPNNGIIYFK